MHIYTRSYIVMRTLLCINIEPRYSVICSHLSSLLRFVKLSSCLFSLLFACQVNSLPFNNDMLPGAPETLFWVRPICCMFWPS